MTPIDLQALRDGNRRALSRALTAVENDLPEGRLAIDALFSHTGAAHLVGVTGAPGTGKSTLVNQLAKTFRQGKQDGPKVAIIAVDPTSPFSDGALLGDRIRMRDLTGDKNIFIRSMASRGALGGLARHTAAFATLLDGAGFDIILIETVGAGQAEVDIARLAHTVLVVEAPGLGDDIQAIKAGILEIADILVVNKADRPGAAETARTLQAMLSMAHGQGSLPAAGKHMRRGTPAATASPDKALSGWQTPVKLVTATEGKGIEKLVSHIQDHQRFLKKSDLWQTKERFRLRQHLEALIQERLVRQWQKKCPESEFEKALDDVLNRASSPYDAAEKLTEN